MALSREQQDMLAEVLSVVLVDNEYIRLARRINERTLSLTEKMLNDLFFCNRATALLFNALHCIPKSPNVYGWLLGCLPGVVQVVKAHSQQLQANMLCLTHIRANYLSEMKLTLL